MSGIRRRAAGLLAVLFLVGWITYPGWYNEYYFTWDQNYAWPASFSNQFDPHWGFWYW